MKGWLCFLCFVLIAMNACVPRTAKKAPPKVSLTCADITDISVLKTLTKHTHWSIRLGGLRLMRCPQIKVSQAIPEYERLLGDSNRHVRQAAGDRLGQVDRSRQKGSRGAAILLRSLTHARWQVRESALVGLGWTRKYKAPVALLHQMIKADHWQIKRQAMILIRHHGPKAAIAIPDILPFLRHKNPYLRGAAVMACMGLISQTSLLLPILIAACKDKHRFVRWQCTHRSRGLKKARKLLIPIIRRLYKGRKDSEARAALRSISPRK